MTITKIYLWIIQWVFDYSVLRNTNLKFSWTRTKRLYNDFKSIMMFSFILDYAKLNVCPLGFGMQAILPAGQPWNGVGGWEGPRKEAFNQLIVDSHHIVWKKNVRATTTTKKTSSQGIIQLFVDRDGAVMSSVFTYLLLHTAAVTCAKNMLWEDLKPQWKVLPPAD